MKQLFGIVMAFVALGVVGRVGRTAAQEPARKVEPAEPRERIRRSLAFLAKEGVQWMNVRKCASCHHVPMMIWSLNEARNRGYEIDQQALNQVTAWALGGSAALVEAKVLPDPTKPPDPRPGANDVNLAAMYLTVASQANARPTPAVREGLDLLAAYLIEKQTAEGFWGSGNGRPPVSDSKEMMTRWTMLALNAPASAASRARAAEWLAKTKPGDDTQELVQRALLTLRADAAEADRKETIDRMLKRQNPDGGWSQTKDLPSDAFATGQVLYLLSEARVKGDRPEVRRAVAFLESSQKSDGSWPMQSRPTIAGGGPAKDLSIIVYAGTAWATIGLMRAGAERI